jgi:hypothetical protein
VKQYDELIKNIKTVPSGDKGVLSVIEATKDIPFKIERVFWITDVLVNQIRGKHAHKSTKQFLICLSGSIEIRLDDGVNRWSTLLDSSSKGLYLPPEIWHTMKWIEGESTLMVLASSFYDEKDYIRSYDEFLQKVANGFWK